MNGILGSLGIDPFYLFIVVFLLQIILIILYVLLNDNINACRKAIMCLCGEKMEKVWKKVFLINLMN